MFINTLMFISLIFISLGNILEGIKDSDWSQLILGTCSLIILIIIKYKEEYTNG